MSLDGKSREKGSASSKTHVYCEASTVVLITKDAMDVEAAKIK
jgi:hypothetical protein